MDHIADVDLIATREIDELQNEGQTKSIKGSTVKLTYNKEEPTILKHDNIEELPLSLKGVSENISGKQENNGSTFVNENVSQQKKKKN